MRYFFIAYIGVIIFVGCKQSNKPVIVVVNKDTTLVPLSFEKTAIDIAYKYDSILHVNDSLQKRTVWLKYVVDSFRTRLVIFLSSFITVS